MTFENRRFRLPTILNVDNFVFISSFMLAIGVHQLGQKEILYASKQIRNVLLLQVLPRHTTFFTLQLVLKLYKNWV